MILDIILIILFICIILYGYKKGAVGIIAKLVTVILSFAIAYLLAETVGEYISKTSLGIKIQTSITTTISDRLNAQSDSGIIIKIQEMLKSSSESELTSKTVEYIFVGIGFMSVFIVSRLVLWIAQKILESIFELPVLKTLNKLGGIIASVLLFIIELSIMLTIIKAISTLSFMNAVVNIIDKSVICKAIYNHNIVTDLIVTKFIK